MVDTSEKVQQVMGRVVSTKMYKTASVRIERRVAHPIYGKYINRSTKLLAHDENNECQEGDMVMIELTRPYSKNKTYKLSRIVERAK
jgi:small subunit ribosomal protein S17